MADSAVAKPWLQTTAAGIVAAADRLKQENPHDLFIMLTRAAASGEWDIFLPAFERVSGVRGIKLLLPAPDGFPMRYAYANAGMPQAYWPVFIAVLGIAAAIAHEAGGDLKPGKRLRTIVLEEAFARPEVKALPFAGELPAWLVA